MLAGALKFFAVAKAAVSRSHGNGELWRAILEGGVTLTIKAARHGVVIPQQASIDEDTLSAAAHVDLDGVVGCVDAV